MVTNRTVVPRRVKTQDTVSLTNWQKVIGVCLLLFYLAMIVITIATLPYVANVAIPHLAGAAAQATTDSEALARFLEGADVAPATNQSHQGKISGRDLFGCYQS
jgi:hypothetical protein